MLLILYLSLFDEQMIVVSPHAYTGAWLYPHRWQLGHTSLELRMNAYAIPVLLGASRFQIVAPLLFWEFNTNSNWPISAALAFILMAITLLLTTLANIVIPRRYRA